MDKANQWIVTAFLLSLIATRTIQDLREYCPFETFKASCPNGKLILINTAFYGRMRLARCISTDIYIDCKANVLTQLDRRCSGRQQCAVALPDSELHQRYVEKERCPKDMMGYLEVSYDCIDVFPAPDMTCHSRPYLTAQQEEKSLSSKNALGTGFGTADCPITVTAATGQKVKMSLMDFSSAGQRRRDRPIHCYIYGTISEPDRRRFRICAGSQRKHDIYTSDSNTIEVIFAKHPAKENNSFILNYQAIDCPDLQAPPNGWVLREGDRATVRCNNTSESWHLVCLGTTWIGQYTNCSNNLGESVIGRVQNEKNAFSTYGLFIAVVIGVAAGVICGSLLLTLVVWCKRRRRTNDGTGSGCCSVIYGEKYQTGVPDIRVQRLQAGQCAYSQIWKVRSMEPSVESASLHVGQQYAADSLPTVEFHRRDHIYESPKFDELSDVGTNCESVHYCTGCSEKLRGASRMDGDETLAVTPLSEDDDDRNENCLLNSPRYKLLSKSLELEQRRRKENHYS